MCRKAIVLFIVLAWLCGMEAYASDMDFSGVKSENADYISEEKEKETEKAVFYQVSLPADSKVYLDPGNLSGRGQIFSDSYQVENYGNTDIAIKIKNIDIYYQSSEGICEFSEDEITDGCSSVKRLQVDMVWKNESEDTEKVLNVCEGTPDEYVLFLKAADYDEDGEFISSVEGGIGSFSFTGTVNPNPDLIWEDGEITVSFSYEIVNMEEEDGVMDPAQQESAVQSGIVDSVQNTEESENTNQEPQEEQDNVSVSDNCENTEGQEDTEHQEETADDTENVEDSETADDTENVEDSETADDAENELNQESTDVSESEEKEETETENSKIEDHENITDHEEKELTGDSAYITEKDTEEEMYREITDDAKNTEKSDKESSSMDEPYSQGDQRKSDKV